MRFLLFKLCAGGEKDLDSSCSNDERKRAARLCNLLNCGFMRKIRALSFLLVSYFGHPFFFSVLRFDFPKEKKRIPPSKSFSSRFFCWNLSSLFSPIVSNILHSAKEKKDFFYGKRLVVLLPRLLRQGEQDHAQLLLGDLPVAVEVAPEQI